MNRKTVKPSSDAKGNRKKSVSASENIYSIIPFVLLVISILLESCLIFPNGTGAVGKAVHSFMCGILGAVSYLIPAGLLMIAFFFFEIRRTHATVVKAVSLSLFVLFFAACQSVFGDPGLSDSLNISVLYQNGIAGIGGGAIGGLIGKLFILAFDRNFSVVISAVICVLALSVFVGPKKVGLWHHFFSAVGKKLPKKAPKPAEEKKVSVSEPAAAAPSSEPAPTPPPTAEPARIETTISQPEPSRPPIPADYNPFSYADGLVSSIPSEIPQATAPTPSASTPISPEPISEKKEEPKKTASFVPAVKNKKSTAYSPFATIDCDEQEALVNSTARKNPSSQNSSSGGDSYSPFSDPMKSMQDTHRTDKNLPPQAYIACGAEYPQKSAQTPPQSDTPVEKKGGISKIFRRGEDIPPQPDIYSNESPIQTPPQPTPSYAVPPQEPAQGRPSAFTPPKPSPEPERKAQRVIQPDYYSPPFEMEDVEEDEEYTDDEVEVDADVMYETPTSAPENGDIRQVYGCEPRYPDYVYPTFDLLDPPKPLNQISEAEVMEIRNTLLEKLSSFRIEATLSGYSVGPTITRYEITPGPGVKVRQITALTDDLALALQSDGVRIATVSGKSVIGVEVPNEKVSTVSLRALLESREFINAKSRITVCVGLTVTGKPVYMDIDDMPHVLIAGETKSGKSVAINCMILSLLYRASPDEVQLILIDPKRVELNIYSKIPHLVMPVIDDPRRAAAALRWAVNEMDRRYMLLDKMGVRNREEYCELRKQDPSLECMPQIIIVIDELADLMLQVREYVEELINRLAAMARACGMHLLVGTQRPSVDIITGLIKANIPARIAFKVSSAQDSRIILGGIGAEKLLGRGDMLYQATGAGRMRIQGAFVSGTEIKRLTNFLIEKNGPAEFDPEILRALDAEMDRMNKSSKKSTYTDDDDDGGAVDGYEPDFDLLCRAIEYILETGKTSTNVIQRVLHVGFNRAADITDALEDMGFLSHKEGNRPREVQVTWEMYEEWKMRKQL